MRFPISVNVRDGGVTVLSRSRVCSSIERVPSRRQYCFGVRWPNRRSTYSARRTPSPPARARVQSIACESFSTGARVDVRISPLDIPAPKCDLRADAHVLPGEQSVCASANLALLLELTLAREDLAGRAVLVEFWATWCPPCRPTLSWLGEVKKRHGDRVVVLAIAVESEEADVRKLAGDLGLPLRWALGTPEVARAFGDVSAVPTLLVFDGQGRAAGAFYGAPPGLHAEAEARLESLLK